MESIMKLEKILNEVSDNTKITVSIFYDDIFSENMKLKPDEIEIVNNSLQINSGYMECNINLENAVIDVEENNKFIEFIDITCDKMWVSLGWYQTNEI